MRRLLSARGIIGRVLVLAVFIQLLQLAVSAGSPPLAAAPSSASSTAPPTTPAQPPASGSQAKASSGPATQAAAVPPRTPTSAIPAAAATAVPQTQAWTPKAPVKRGPSLASRLFGTVSSATTAAGHGLQASAHWLGSLAGPGTATAQSVAVPAATPLPNPTPTEIVSRRTAGSRTWDNGDGTFTTKTGNNLNYESSPGIWDPVDLTFHPSGSDFVASHAAVTVTVSAPGVAATDRATGKGLRWLTPTPPSVSGTAAYTSAQGLSWAYVATPVGMNFSAVVTSAQGPKTYKFNYQLLGGAAPLSVDTSGALVSDGLMVSRANVIDSRGQSQLAGAWQLLPGPRRRLQLRRLIPAGLRDSVRHRPYYLHFRWEQRRVVRGRGVELPALLSRRG